MHSDSEMVKMLKGIDLFSGLSKKELAIVAGCLRPLSHDDGDEIVSQGATDGRIFIVTSGTAVASANGKKLASFGPGSYFGEISLIDKGPRTATVKASGPVSTLSAASFSVRPVLKANPGMMLKLLVSMCERVRTLDKRLVQ